MISSIFDKIKKGTTLRHCLFIGNPAAGVIACWYHIQRSRGESKTNINVILIDDAGFTDVGCTGLKALQTRTIDLLAASSIVLIDAHVTASLCRP